MSREILFRGKTEKGEWLYGFYHNETSIESSSSDRKITRHHIYTQDFDKFVMPETIGQFTGSTDKNGKKIFEGDIVKYFFGYENGKENREILLVVWDKEYCKFMLEEQRTKQRIDLCEFEKTEIIGNIHDNPELL